MLYKQANNVILLDKFYYRYSFFENEIQLHSQWNAGDQILFF